MKKVITVTIGCLLTLAMLPAQTMPCAAIPPAVDSLILYRPDYAARVTRTPVTIRVLPHIIRRDDGSGGMSTATLSNAMVMLQQQYVGTDINFEILPAQYHNSTTYFNLDESGGVTELHELTFDNNNEGALNANESNALNLYFINSILNGGAAGRALYNKRSSN